MGIKGIYKEIGAGKRISLTKLAIDKLEETGRPLRIAIDISIWQFQVQAARGGSNPAIRTLFYRLLRLLGLSIQPIFVFDGPNKPTFKRNKRSGRGDGVATSMAKRMIKLFGFKVHDAPGEAEAECALLQRAGIVDAVLSEDVDTIMFGCTRTLRNWSAEGTKGSKTPTHVSMYNTEELQKSDTGLDREGMVLVALMSGGDYIPEGIPGAGVKLACEAARAGFGKSLCRLKKADTSELASWKEYLTYELRHNESGFFRTRHKAISVPEDFPNLDVLRYYTHPVVSPAFTLDRLRGQSWDRTVDIEGLREFVRETFDWNYRGGAVKFIRVLAPCLLVRKMMARSVQTDQGTKSVECSEKEESELVTSITSRRTHFSTGAIPELRLSFIPTKIVGYDFQEEPDEVIDYGRNGLALNSDDDFEALAEEDGPEAAGKSSGRKPFSPTGTDLAWIPETITKLGIPITVENWEETQRSKLTRQRTKAQKPKDKVVATNSGALDKFVNITKNISRGKDPGTAPQPPLPAGNGSRFGITEVPSQNLTSVFTSSQTSQKARPSRPSKQPKSKSKSTTRNASPASRLDAKARNPWTIAGSQNNSRTAGAKSTRTSETIIISSSPPTSPNQDGNSSMSRPEGCATEASSPPSSPLKRRSVTPTRSSGENYKISHLHAAVKAHSPSPKSSEKKPQRKLARTESLPLKQSPQRSPTEGRGIRQLARARTLAVETLLSDSEDDSDFDLPPLSTIIGKLPQKNTKSGNINVSQLAEPEPQRREKEQDKTKQQATLDSAFSATKRTTRVYIPRKSEPGFFREIEVEVEEIDDLFTNTTMAVPRNMPGKGVMSWRHSDISCIDLTGED